MHAETLRQGSSNETAFAYKNRADQQCVLCLGDGVKPSTLFSKRETNCLNA
jgi:hypothetical protein